jgi:hypothetical protein
LGLLDADGASTTIGVWIAAKIIVLASRVF